MTSLSIILMDVILLVFLLMLSIPLPVSFAVLIERATVFWFTSSCIKPPFRQGSR